MWQKGLKAVGCLTYLALLGGLFALVSYTTFNLFVRRGVTPTPELSGMSEEDARALLVDQGLILSWSEQDGRFDEEVPAGHAVNQNPQPGTLVKRGSSVTVVLSKGPQRIEVPDVGGRALQAAQVTLAAAGLTLGRTMSIYSADGKPGTVVAQHPPSGTRLERGGAVSLFLSLEVPAETYIMPDLVHQTYEEVRTFFTRRGYRLGRVSYEAYAGIPAGTILRQYPRAGHPLQQGDVISLGVALGEGEPETEAEAEEESE